MNLKQRIALFIVPFMLGFLLASGPVVNAVTQGGIDRPDVNTLNVESGGTLRVKSGGTIQFDAGSTVTISTPTAPAIGQQEYNRTSAQLKVSTPTSAGLRFFDTTLNQPVWSSGTATCRDYVNSTGTIPSGY